MAEVHQFLWWKSASEAELLILKDLLADSFGQGLAVEADRGDGVADFQGYLAAMEGGGVHGEDLAGAGDGQRDDRHAGFDGDVGGAVFKRLQNAIVGASAFGKDQD